MQLKFGVVKLVLILAFAFAFILNWSILIHFYTILSTLEHFKLGFAISIPLVLVAALNVVFMPFSFKYLLKPFFVLMFLLGSLASYAMIRYRVLFDYGMIQNIFETNPGEASAYLNPTLLFWLLLTGVVPSLLLLRTEIIYPASGWRGLGQRLLSMTISLVLVAGVAALYYQDYASVGRNNPTLNREIVPANFVYGTFKYVKNTYLTKREPFATLGEDARQVVRGDKPTLLFLAIGETARSSNYALNGYDRPTNPFTEQEPGLVSFRHVSSCGTATAVSVPCMFSNMTRKTFDGSKASNSEGLLDVVQHAGVSVFWKENDGGCKGVCDRVPNMVADPKLNPDFCRGETCFDEVLLKNLDQEIAQMKGDKLIGFHLIGSHGPTYYLRYPDAQRFFTPDCPRSDIENCSNEELLNTYDNTIRYTDYVIAKLIAKLKHYEQDYNVGLIYLSDHGESLGAMGLYLHGTPYKFAPDDQTKVPMLSWFSPGFLAHKGIDMGCLKQAAASKRYSQDNLFHSVLGLLGISTRVYDPVLDIFATCRR
jgi:lipid A ethanolaminephosphotransferase